MTLLLTMVSACKSTSPSQNYASGADSEPTTFDLKTSTLENPIDNMPFQFWLETGSQKILATNRTRDALNYTSQNNNLDIPVSSQAIQCMRHVFATIEKEQIKTSKLWKSFKDRYPYRFLEILPELKDFYSAPSPNEATTNNFSQLTMPVLWNGFEPESGSSDTGFKLRGYLKWSGVLLPDGITCLVATKDQILKLLERSLQCEAGDIANCNVPTEIAP